MKPGGMRRRGAAFHECMLKVSIVTAHMYIYIMHKNLKCIISLKLLKRTLCSRCEMQYMCIIQMHDVHER